MLQELKIVYARCQSVLGTAKADELLKLSINAMNEAMRKGPETEKPKKKSGKKADAA